MRISRVAMFGAGLGVAVVTAVAGLVAQDRSEPREMRRPRVMMLDGRGGQLGVSVQDLDAKGLEAAGAPGGVRIEDVDQGSVAEKAGLREGDIVIEIDGERVRSSRQFARLIQETPEGRSLKLGILRNKQRQTIDVTPENRAFGFFDGDRLSRDFERSMREIDPQLREIEPRLREIEPRLRELEPRLREFRFDGDFGPFNFDFDMLPRMTSPRARLGVQLGQLTPQLAEYFGAKDGGVLVSSVTSDSPAAKAGIKAGDVITSINGDRVRDSEELIDELRDTGAGEVTIGIVRDRKVSTVKAAIEDERPRRVRPSRPI